MLSFEIIDKIEVTENIAVGKSIRELDALNKLYGYGRWRKLKGIANVRLRSGEICKAEVHWYEAHGIGKRGLKIKRFII